MNWFSKKATSNTMCDCIDYYDATGKAIYKCAVRSCGCQCHGFGHGIEQYQQIKKPMQKEDISELMQQMDKFMADQQEWLNKTNIAGGLKPGNLFPTNNPFKGNPANIVYFDEEQTKQMQELCKIFPEIMEMIEWFRRIKAMQGQ